MKKILIPTIILLSLLIFLPQKSLAYVEISQGDNLIASVTPANPKAGDIVQIDLRAYGFNLGNRVITWSINDKVVLSALGITNYRFQMGEPGTITKVQVDLIADNYVPKKKALYFQSSEIDLLWQTDSYVPPFYQGKALPSSGSSLKVVAIPTIVDHLGKRVSNNLIDFHWKKDGVLSTKDSGFGRNYFVFKTDPDSRSVNVSVEADVASEKITSVAGTTIALQTPRLLFYENQPLSGIAYQKIISGEYPLSSDEVTIKAEPYYLSVSNPADIIYKWLVNGDTIANNTDDPASATFRQKTGTEGVSSIGASAKSAGTGQATDNNFIIKFGSKLINFNGQ